MLRIMMHKIRQLHCLFDSVERYVCFVRPSYFIVMDHVKCLKLETHTYHQNWHFQPQAGIALDQAGQVRTHFEKNANLLVVPVVDSEELRAAMKTGYYSQHTNRAVIENHRYISYEKEAVGDTAFQTLIYPMKSGQQVNIQALKLPVSLLDSDARAMCASVVDDEGNMTSINFYQLLNVDKKTDVIFGDYKTDGSMALVEYMNGEFSRIILRGGQYIKDCVTGQEILRLSQRSEYIGICFNGTVIRIESSKVSTDIRGLVVYIGNRRPDTVLYNGRQ